VLAAIAIALCRAATRRFGGYPTADSLVRNQRDRSTLCCKCLRRRQAHTEPAPVTSATFFSKTNSFDRFLLHLMILPFSCAWLRADAVFDAFTIFRMPFQPPPLAFHTGAVH